MSQLVIPLSWKTAGRRHFFLARTGANTVFEEKRRSLSSHVVAGERRRHCRHPLPCVNRPRARVIGFQLRPLPGKRSPLGPRQLGMGTLSSLATQGRLEIMTPRRSRVAGLLLLLDKEPSGSPARMLAVINTLIMGFREGSRCIVPCTKMWDTSTCITRCASGWDATSDRITAILVAKLYIASHTRSQVSYVSIS